MDFVLPGSDDWLIFNVVQIRVLMNPFSQVQCNNAMFNKLLNSTCKEKRHNITHILGTQGVAYKQLLKLPSWLLSLVLHGFRFIFNETSWYNILEVFSYEYIGQKNDTYKNLFKKL